jgi:hypothetical protein
VDLRRRLDPLGWTPWGERLRHSARRRRARLGPRVVLEDLHHQRGVVGEALSHSPRIGRFRLNLLPPRAL